METQSDAAWLVPICLQIVPAICLFVGMIWMPFSPRWLVHHGREEEARQVLIHLRDLPAEHELIQLEFLEIKAQSQFEKRSLAERFPHLQEQTAWNVFKLQFVAIQALFTSMSMFRRVIVATTVMFFQQWTGINAVSSLARGRGEMKESIYRLEGCTNCAAFLIGPLLRPPDLPAARPRPDSHQSPRNRSSGNRHVHCHSSCCALD